MPTPILSILQQALATGSRSTVLKPLGWLIGLTLVGAIGAFQLQTPFWFATILAALCIAAILLYVVAYVYFALTDKDSLRSEKYSIQKLAIKKGFVGDDVTGYIQVSTAQQPSDQNNLLDIPKRSEQE